MKKIKELTKTIINDIINSDFIYYYSFFLFFLRLPQPFILLKILAIIIS